MNNLIQEGTFFNPTCGEMKLEGVLEELIAWMSGDSISRYEIVIATDSDSDLFPRFPVVIAVRKFLGSSGKGGRFFVEKISFGTRRFHTFRDRIWEEAQCSVGLGCLIRDGLKSLIEEKGIVSNYMLEEVHLDVGDNGPTRAMIAELCGFVVANGFKPVIKPEAWATRVADRYS